MGRYLLPDTSEWDGDDIRNSVIAFDEGLFREKYNDELSEIQCSLEKHQLGFNIIEREFLDTIIALDGHVLDIGCGNGRLVTSLVAHKYVQSGTGIDVSDMLIENAHGTVSNADAEVQLHCIAVEYFIPDKQFDAITAVEVLEHLYSPRENLQRIAGWLKPSGMFAGSVPLRRVNDCDQHLHYFTQDSLGNLLSDFFDEVDVTVLDVQGGWQLHLIFVCNQPKKR